MNKINIYISSRLNYLIHVVVHSDISTQPNKFKTIQNYSIIILSKKYNKKIFL